MSAERDARPCAGRNVNVCVAEGCYGEACIRVTPPGQCRACREGVPREIAPCLCLTQPEATS